MIASGLCLQLCFGPYRHLICNNALIQVPKCKVENRPSRVMLLAVLAVRIETQTLGGPISGRH